jgi:hypothetical protein
MGREGWQDRNIGGITLLLNLILPLMECGLSDIESGTNAKNGQIIPAR